LPKVTYQIKVEYYEGGDNALIYVWWEEVEPISPFAPVITPAPAPVSIPSVSAAAPAPFDGWYGEYYENRGNALIYVWWEENLPRHWQ